MGIVFSWLCLLLSLCAFAEGGETVGSLSMSLVGTSALLADFGYKICYLIAGGLLITAALRYQQHRKNPSQVRLGEVFGALFFALLVGILPFLADLSMGAQIMQNFGGNASI